jgi:arylformamidase
MLTRHAKIIDVTLPLSYETPVWPGDPAIAIAAAGRIAEGAAANTSTLFCPTHCGTHVDPPWHFVEGGAKLDQIPIERWVGHCQVIRFADHLDLIEPVHLDAALVDSSTTRLLMRTRSSSRWAAGATTFDTNFPALSPAAADWIVARGIDLIGIDSLGFEPFVGTDGLVHRIILSAGIVAIEGLFLAGVSPGFYDLVCLPLNLRNGDGAPARVILIEHERA